MNPTATLWERRVRLIHWLIAAGIVLNLFILEEGDPPHQWVGYTVASAVACRLMVGFLGSGNAKFSHWPLRWSELQHFVRRHRTGKAQDYPGHNPAAAWSYLAIWSLLWCLAVSGWMMGLDVFFGEDWLEELHEAFAVILQGLILIHFAGILLDAFTFRRKTWLGMITGRRDPL